MKNVVLGILVSVVMLLFFYYYKKAQAKKSSSEVGRKNTASQSDADKKVSELLKSGLVTPSLVKSPIPLYSTELKNPGFSPVRTAQEKSLKNLNIKESKSPANQIKLGGFDRVNKTYTQSYRPVLRVSGTPKTKIPIKPSPSISRNRFMGQISERPKYAML